jgi:eukaryotic-like serine/threonine-protein kinase
LRRRRLGETHPSVAESWGNLAELLLDKGDPVGAEQAYKEALAIYRATLPPGHVFIAGSLMGVGSALTDQGRATEAEPLLREALDIRIASVGVEDRRTARAQRLLGHCLLKLGRRAEAEPLLVRSYGTLSEAEGWYYGLVRQQALQDLVELYRSWGKPAEAARYRELLGS